MHKIIELIKRILRFLFASNVRHESALNQKNLYKVKKFFFSSAENKFYQVLRSVVGESYVIFSKVRLADVLDIAGGENRQSAFNRISRKHIDFLLCSHDYFNPLLIIELDDSSHKRQHRQERDEFLNEICEASEIPLLRIPVRQAYNIMELEQDIQKAIGHR